MNSIYQDLSAKVTGSTNELLGYELEHNEDAISNSLVNLFTIQKGEMPGKPWFGNPLNIALFDLFDEFEVENLKSAVKNEIAQFEPRITVEDIRIVVAKEYNKISVQIDYSYNIADALKYNSIDIPYSHNSISYLGGRDKPTDRKPIPTACILKR